MLLLLLLVALDVCCCRRRRGGSRRSRRNNNPRNPQKSHLKKNRTKNQPSSFGDFLPLSILSILILLLLSAEKPMKSRKPPTPQTKTAHGNSCSDPLIPISPFSARLHLRNQRYHHPRTQIDRISRLHTHKRPESENCAAVEDSCEEVEDEEEVGEGSGGEGLS